MIIFHFGPDSYRLKRGTTAMIDRYKKKYPSGMNFFVLDCAQVEGRTALTDALRSLSFLEEVKLIVCANVFQKKDIAQACYEILTTHDALSAKETVILVEAPADSKKLLSTHKELYNLLTKKPAVVDEFQFLEGAPLVRWVQKEFSNRQCTIGTQEASELLRRTGTDSGALMQEIEKISSFVRQGSVPLEAIQQLVPQQAATTIFELVDAFATQKKQQAFLSLSRELGSGQDPHYILSLLLYQVRNMLMVRDLLDRHRPFHTIAAQAGLSPFVARKSVAQAQQFTQSSLHKLYQHLSQLEESSKNGTAHLEDELYRVIFSHYA